MTCTSECDTHAVTSFHHDSVSLLLFFSLIFGAITCITGFLGVAMGVAVSRKLRTRTPRADPLVCASGLLLSAPFLYLAIVFAQTSTIATYVSPNRVQLGPRHVYVSEHLQL